MSEIRKAIQHIVKGLIKSQTVWVEVTEVNWTDKTMTCKSLDDDLKYHDVLLSIDDGAGDVLRPKVGTQALLGLVENQEAATYMIWCKEYDERIIMLGTKLKLHLKDNGDVLINGDQYGGLVKVQQLTDELNKLVTDVNQLKAILTTWLPVAQDGGGALKLALGQWPASQLQQVVKPNIENQTVKHG